MHDKTNIYDHAPIKFYAFLGDHTKCVYIFRWNGKHEQAISKHSSLLYETTCRKMSFPVNVDRKRRHYPQRFPLASNAKKSTDYAFFPNKGEIRSARISRMFFSFYSDFQLSMSLSIELCCLFCFENPLSISEQISH